MPAEGFRWLFVLPLANAANAAWAPPMSSSYPNPKAPLQSVMIATLTGPVALPAASDAPATTKPATSAASGTRIFQLRNLTFLIRFLPQLNEQAQLSRIPVLCSRSLVALPLHRLLSDHALVLPARASQGRHRP